MWHSRTHGEKGKIQMAYKHHGKQLALWPAEEEPGS